VYRKDHIRILIEQKHLTIRGIKICYEEVNPDKEKTLLFIHGNSISSKTWKKQLSSNTLTNYRLIAIDLPAHGDSDPSADPDTDYSLPGLGKILAEAINSLINNKHFILIGLSLGSNILAEALAHTSTPLGIVLAGSCIVGGEVTVESFMKPDTNVFVVFTDDATEIEIRNYAYEVIRSARINDIEQFVFDYKRVKIPFRTALNTSIKNADYSNEISLLSGTNLPLLIIFGENDKIIDPNYLDDVKLPFWKGKVHRIPKAGHLVHLDHPIQFNLLIASYAQEMFS